MAANAADLAEETKAAARAAADAAVKLTAEAQKSFAEAARKFESVVQEGVEQMRAQSRTYADNAGEHIDEAQRYVTERVRERPLAATGAAIGVGVLIGLLLAAGRRN